MNNTHTIELGTSVFDATINYKRVLENVFTVRYCLNNNPKLIIMDLKNKCEYIYNYNTGFVGKQLLMFNV